MASKAFEAVKKLQGQKTERQGFDRTKLNVLWESEPVEVSARAGVITVEIYSYDGGEPRLGIYRVGVDREGKEWRTRQLCNLSSSQALELAAKLHEGAKELTKILRKAA